MDNIKVERSIVSRESVVVKLSVADAKRIRAALSDLDGEDLWNYGGILEQLRCVIPQQWG